MNFKTRVTKSDIRLHEQCCERISINASIFAYSKRNRDSLVALLILTLHSASTQPQSNFSFITKSIVIICLMLVNGLDGSISPLSLLSSKWDKDPFKWLSKLFLH